MTESRPAEPDAADDRSRVAQVLVENHRAFLRYLAVDVDETPVKVFAETAGLTASNAGVRLSRAREALRRQVVASCGTCAEHGCVDCSCGTLREPCV